MHHASRITSHNQKLKALFLKPVMNLMFLLSFISIALAVASFGPVTFLGSNSRYEVKRLPGLPFSLYSWAGQFDVPNGAPGDQIFFWLFAAEEKLADENLIIWLNGGPGCSSLISMTLGNGPFVINGDIPTLKSNPYSWTKLANVLYIDQPVGTGFSVAGNTVLNNAQVIASFVSWLGVFFAQFPHLRKKRIHLMGESYAGIYIPYFAEAILQNGNPLDINLESISLGDATFGNNEAASDVSITAFLEEQQSQLQIPPNIVATFHAASEVCGFTNRMKQAEYPPRGKIYLPLNPHGDTPLLPNGQRSLSKYKECNIKPNTGEMIQASIFHSPCYPQCAIWETAANYLATVRRCFDIYNILSDCKMNPLLPIETYFNRPDVRTALHISEGAPTRYQACNREILDGLPDQEEDHVIPPAYHIIPSLLGVGIHVRIYVGELDLLVNHKGIELILQNMTWGGAQGFKQRPNHTFEGGIWGQERNLSYHLFEKAGHVVPKDMPKEAFGFVKDFVLGSQGT